MSEQEHQPQDTVQETQSTESLLDSVAPELGEGEYFLSDGIKGTGDKPDWYQSDKYKSVAEQARAHNELQKKFGSFTGAPKEGYELPEGFDPDHPLVEKLNETLSKANGNQELYNDLMSLVSEFDNVNKQIDADNEMKKLGDNAGERIKTVETFLKNNAGDSYEDIQALVVDANSVQLVEKMINVMAPRRMPIEGGEHPQGLTWSDVEEAMFAKDENGRLRRSADPEYNKKVEAMIESFGGQQ